MKRRTFINGASAAFFVSAMPGSEVIQKAAAADPAWSDLCQLYGSAIEILPKSESGAPELLNVGFGSTQFFGSNVVGIAHNPTDTPPALVEVVLGEEHGFPDLACAHTVLAPGAHSLVQVSALWESAEMEAVPEMEAVFAPPDEEERIAAIQPLRVAEYSAEGFEVALSVSNETDVDIDEHTVRGILMWFNNDGEPIGDMRFEVAMDIPSGESVEFAEPLSDDFDADAPFLTGFWSDPSLAQ